MSFTKLLRPIAEGTYTNFGRNGGSGNVNAVDPGDPVSHNDGTSYMFRDATSPDGPHSYTMTGWPDVNVVATIDDLTLGIRHEVDDAINSGQPSVFSRVTGEGNSSAVNVTPSGSWATYGPVSIPRVGGTAWHPVDITAGIEFAFDHDGGANFGDFYVTSLWGYITYSKKAGAWAAFVGALAAIGLLGSHFDFNHISTIISRYFPAPDNYLDQYEYRMLREALMGGRLCR